MLIIRENRGNMSVDFIIYDFKNDKVLENYPLSTDNLSNIAQTDSNLPPEMSPIFFNVKVLDKYKDNKTAINLEHGVNDSGQIYVYAYYLSNLPVEEQQHWVNYNETPKENFKNRWEMNLSRYISRKSIEINFKGVPYHG